MVTTATNHRRIADQTSGPETPDRQTTPDPVAAPSQTTQVDDGAIALTTMTTSPITDGAISFVPNHPWHWRSLFRQPQPDTMLIVSYTDSSDGSPNARLLCRDFKFGAPNCVDGHSLIELRSVAEATYAALEHARTNGYKKAEILVGSAFCITQFGPGGSIDFLDFEPTGTEKGDKAAFKAFVGDSMLKNFQEQLQGVRRWLLEHPDAEMAISFRIVFAEQEPAYRAAMAKTA